MKRFGLLASLAVLQNATADPQPVRDIAGWPYQGCALLSPETLFSPTFTKIQKFAPLDVEGCLGACTFNSSMPDMQFYQYAGLNSGTCYCATDLSPMPNFGVDSQCNFPCAANSAEACGGGLDPTANPTSLYMQEEGAENPALSDSEDGTGSEEEESSSEGLMSATKTTSSDSSSGSATASSSTTAGPTSSDSGGGTSSASGMGLPSRAPTTATRASVPNPTVSVLSGGAGESFKVAAGLVGQVILVFGLMFGV